MPCSKPVKNTIFMVCAVAVCVSIASGCDAPQETKFDEANEAVTNEVTFGGPSGAQEAPRSVPAPTRPSEPEPSRSPVILRRALEDLEIVHSKRAPRQRKARSTGPSITIERGGGVRAPTPLAPPTGSAPSEGVVKSGAAQPAGVAFNPMTRVTDDALSTFSIDVDTGSYTLARRTINQGGQPSAPNVRVEEFVNYFKYDYPNPKEGAFGVSLDAAPSPFKPAANRKIVRVGVQGKQLEQASRKPVHLTFLVDVSGSMGGHDRIDLAKESLQILSRNLGEGDTIAISTYSGRVERVLGPTRTVNRGKITSAINSLKAGGSTRMGDGLKLAYESALESFVAGDVNRVIVLSDGDANVGPQSHDEILASIRSYVEEGVTLSTIGFGMGNYKDSMMEQLANKGNGNYYYIDSKKEAYKVFGEQLDGTLQVIAKDVKIQVEFDADAVRSYRLIGYENRDIADADFRRDRVDAGEIGAGHSVTALYEIVLTEAAARGKSIAHLATVRIRAKKPTGTKAAEQEFVLTTKDMRPTLADASADFQFATAVAGFAEVLRDSPYAQSINLALIEELAKSASRADQADRQEFIGLVSKVRAQR